MGMGVGISSGMRLGMGLGVTVADMIRTICGFGDSWKRRARKRG
jgi:hypothetical protein